MATACFHPNSTGDIGTKCCKIPVSLKNNKLSLESKFEEFLYKKNSMDTAQEISCSI